MAQPITSSSGCGAKTSASSGARGAGSAAMQLDATRRSATATALEIHGALLEQDAKFAAVIRKTGGGSRGPAYQSPCQRFVPGRG